MEKWWWWYWEYYVLGWTRSSVFLLFLFFKDFIFLILEREKDREKERERNIDERDKHRSVASGVHPTHGLNIHPRHVPSPGIRPVTLCFLGGRLPTEPHQSGLSLYFLWLEGFSSWSTWWWNTSTGEPRSMERHFVALRRHLTHWR